MSESEAPITKTYFDEQIGLVVTTVKTGFDHVDERFQKMDERFDSVDERFDAVANYFTSIDGEMKDIKSRLRGLENEVRTLSATMITKEYLDAKIDLILAQKEKDSLFKRTLLLALEASRALSPDMRAKLEALIP